MLRRIEVHSIDGTGFRDGVRIEEFAAQIGRHLPQCFGQTCASRLGTVKLWHGLDLGPSERGRRDDQHGWSEHPGLDWRAPHFVHNSRYALCGGPGVVEGGVELKIIGPQHDDCKREGGVHFHPGAESGEAVSPGFEWVFPNSAAAVQAVFDDAEAPSGRKLHDAGPALFKRQALPGSGYNSPAQGVAIDQNTLHIGAA
jgi:hypothetical protein